MTELQCLLKDIFWIIKILIKSISAILLFIFVIFIIYWGSIFYLHSIKEKPFWITKYEIWTQKDLGVYLEDHDKDKDIFIYVLSKNIKYKDEEYYMFGTRYDPHLSFNDFQEKFIIKKDDIHILEIERYQVGSTIYSYYCPTLFVFDTYKPKYKHFNYKNYEIKKDQYYYIGCSKQPNKNHIKIKDEWIKLKKDK